MVLFRVSISRTLFMRDVVRIISAPVAWGWEPPVRPVLPPCGTTGVALSAQMAITAATSSTLAGFTTMGTQPCQLSRQDWQKGAISSGSMV